MKGSAVAAMALMVLVGRIAASSNTGLKARSYTPGENPMEAQYYRDLVAAFDWKTLLEHVPGVLFPILEKILKGLARSKDPGEIIEAILTGKFRKEKKKRRRRKKKEPEPKKPEPKEPTEE